MKTSISIVKFLLIMLGAIIVAGGIFDLSALEGGAALAFMVPFALKGSESSNDLKQLRKQVWDEMESMVQLRKTEKRDFSEAETTKYAELRSEFDRLHAKIADVEADEKRALIMAGAAFRNQDDKKIEKELSGYSFSRAIMAQVNKTEPTGLEAEMHQEAIKEMRDANTGKAIEGVGIPSILFRTYAGGSVTGQTAVAGDKGGMLVETEKVGLMHALRPFLVLGNLGARMMGGLQGNIDFPKGSAAAAGWKTEVAAADEYAMTFSVVPLKPNRLPAWAAYSKQLLLQSAPDVENFIRTELLRAIAQAVEAAAIAGTGTNQPTGIIATTGIGSVVGGTAGLAPTWAHIVDLEEKVAVENADIGAMAYLTNAKVRSKLKKTLKAAGVSGYVWETGESATPLNSYQCGVTNLVPSNLTKTTENLSAIIFGDFSKLIMGQWGGLDIVVDPYTQKKAGVVEIAVNSYWDSAVLEPKAFAAMLDAITA